MVDRMIIKAKKNTLVFIVNFPKDMIHPYTKDAHGQKYFYAEFTWLRRHKEEEHHAQETKEIQNYVNLCPSPN